MAFIIDTINGSGLYAQSAASASVATYDSNGNVITATYLTAHQSISADEWNSSYETVQTNSASWAGGGGTIESYNLSAGNYINITKDDVNSAIGIETTGLNVTNWNSNYDTVNTNSGAWGGQTLPISAGPGIKLDVVNGTLVASNDETVLWSGDAVVNESNTFNLSESLFNFGSIKIYDKSINGNAVPLRVTEISFRDNTQTYRFGTNDVWIDGWNPSSYASHYQGWNFYSANIEGTTIATMGSLISHMNNSGAPGVRNIGHIYEVIGINRINNA